MNLRATGDKINSETNGRIHKALDQLHAFLYPFGQEITANITCKYSLRTRAERNRACT